MKAIVHTKYGSPDVLELQDIPKPIPKDDELLVKVYATTVNRTDCGFLRAKPFVVRFFSGLTRPKNTSLGCEFAGVIEAVGRDVRSFQVNDRVFGYNEKTFGGHAEYLTMSAGGMVTTMPTKMTFAEAAPSTEGAHYALSGLRAAGVKEGQRILVYGATGAIGSAAVQLAKYFGAHVTAVCRTEHVDVVASRGADRVIDYTQIDYSTLGGEYDSIFDAVGKSTFGIAKKVLKPQGIYYSTELGPRGENPWLAMWTPLMKGKKVIFPIPKETRADIELLKKLLEEGKYWPMIDRQYSLEQVPEAFRYVETGQKIGNVVIIVRR